MNRYELIAKRIFNRTKFSVRNKLFERELIAGRYVKFTKIEALNQFTNEQN